MHLFCKVARLKLHIQAYPCILFVCNFVNFLITIFHLDLILLCLISATQHFLALNSIFSAEPHLYLHAFSDVAQCQAHKSVRKTIFIVQLFSAQRPIYKPQPTLFMAVFYNVLQCQACKFIRHAILVFLCRLFLPGNQLGFQGEFTCFLQLHNEMGSPRAFLKGQQIVSF